MAQRLSTASSHSSGGDSLYCPDGGLEYDFVTPPPDHLNCRICLLILNDPHLTSCCGHHFCHSCITRALQRSRACPLCNAPFTIFRAQNIIRQVNALPVKCSHKSAGCEWLGELGKLSDHLRECGYVPVRCGKCGEYVQQRLFQKHQDLLCLFRVYDCVYCMQFVATYKEVKEQHWPRCGYFPIPCPNDCPKGSIPRNHLMTHLKSECKIKQQLKNAQSRNNELSEQVRQLKRELDDANAKIRDLEKELGDGRKFEQMEQQVVPQQAQPQQIPVNEVQRHRSEPRDGEQQWNDLSAPDREPARSAPGDQTVFGVRYSEGNAQISPVVEGGRKSRSPSLSTDLHHEALPQVQPVQEERQVTVHVPSPIAVQGDEGTEPDIVHDSSLTLEWQRQENLPEVLYGGSAAVVGNFVYAGGGTCQRTGSYDNECTVFKYDYRNNVCCSLPVTDRHKFAMVSFQNQLVLVGGATPTTACLSSLLVWDEEQHHWDEKRLPPMHTPRMQPCAVSQGMYIFVAGGKDAEVLSSVEVFNGNCKQWYEVAPLPSAMYSSTSAVLKGYWYVMGGFGQKKAVYCAALELLIQSALRTVSKDVCQRWNLLPDTDFEFAAAAAFGNSILAIGGSKSIGATDAVRVYFPGRKIWLPIDQPLPRPFHSGVAVVVPGVHEKELLVLGGCTDFTRYKHIYKCTIHHAV